MLLSNVAVPLLSLAAFASAAPAPVLESRTFGLGFQTFLGALFGPNALAVTQSPFTQFYYCGGRWFGWDKAAALTFSCVAQNNLCLVKSRWNGLCDSTCADQLKTCITSGDADANPGPKPTTTSNYGSLPAGWASAAPYLVAEAPNNARALTGSNQNGMQWADANTPQSCINFCKSGGWPVAGLEYGSECWCGASLSNGAALNVYSYNPVLQCSGDSSLNCGSQLGLNLFYDTSVVIKTPTNFKPISKSTPVACLKETGAGSARLFNGTSFTDDDMTPQKCTSFCRSSGAKQAGIEYGRECYCSSTVNLATATTSDQCTFACGPSDRVDTCGGPDALSVYLA